MGLFGVSFLLGIVIGCVTLARAGDIVGRKPIFILGMLIQIGVTIGLLFSKNATTTYLLMSAFGVAITAKQFVGYAYLLEILPSSKQVVIGSMEFVLEALCYLSICLYFYFISKEWQYI